MGICVVCCVSSFESHSHLDPVQLPIQMNSIQGVMNVIHHFHNVEKIDFKRTLPSNHFLYIFLIKLDQHKNIAELESPSVFEIFSERWIYFHYILITL